MGSSSKFRQQKPPDPQSAGCGVEHLNDAGLPVRRHAPACDRPQMQPGPVAMNEVRACNTSRGLWPCSMRGFRLRLVDFHRRVQAASLVCSLNW